MSTLKDKVCDACGQRNNLACCSSCQIVFFCAQEHPSTRKCKYKSQCAAVHQARQKLESEERDLRDPPTSPLGLAINNEGDYFETGVGHFWRIHETRIYMRARQTLILTLLNHFGNEDGHVAAVEIALEHSLDMLRLCRSDDLCIQDLIPALYIRLGSIQEAYEFIKWSSFTGRNPFYDWDGLRLPFLDLKGADVLEDPVSTWPQWFSSSLALHLVAPVVLIKIRILLGFQAMRNTAVALQGVLPPELIHMISTEAAKGFVNIQQGIFNGNWEVLSRREHLIAEQVRYLHKHVHKEDHQFWDVLLYPEEEFQEWDVIKDDSLLNRRRKHSVILYNYWAWMETPGAIEMMKDIHPHGSRQLDHSQSDQFSPGCILNH